MQGLLAAGHLVQLQPGQGRDTATRDSSRLPSGAIATSLRRWRAPACAGVLVGEQRTWLSRSAGIEYKQRCLLRIRPIHRILLRFDDSQRFPLVELLPDLLGVSCIRRGAQVGAIPLSRIREITATLMHQA